MVERCVDLIRVLISKPLMIFSPALTPDTFLRSIPHDLCTYTDREGGISFSLCRVSLVISLPCHHNHKSFGRVPSHVSPASLKTSFYAKFPVPIVRSHDGPVF